MENRTRRRAFLGALAVTAVGGAGYYANRQRSTARWLGPAASLSESPTFAHVSGLFDPGSDGDLLDVEFALRERADEGRTIVLFGETDDPIERYLPPLRSFWRLDVDVGGRPSGTYTLSVGDRSVPVELTDDLPTEATRTGIELTPRSVWRADHIAFADGYETTAGQGRMRVAFRSPADATALDAVEFRTPAGETVGRRSVPDDVWETGFTLDPLRVYSGNGQLLGFRAGQRVDAFELFYH